MKETLKIVKIGGNIIEDKQILESFLKDFARLKGPKLLVHGGGKSATKLAAKLNLKPTLYKGRRITDKDNLDVAIMVYAGLINKNIVAQLQANACESLGLSGADANTVLATKRPVKEVDFGFVGDIISVNAQNIKLFLDNNISPVFCALSHNKQGQLLNTNADTIASEIAIALSAFYTVELNYIFELKGVLSDINDKESVITKINLKDYTKLLDAAKISEGMLPKLHNCFRALEKGVYQVKIGDKSLVSQSDNLHTTLSLK